MKVIGARQDDKILDVATGTGKQAFAYARQGYNVTGIDLSAGMLKIAIKHNKFKNLNFKIADATAMPFPDNEFGISSISFALHDMPAEIRKRVLSEMVRVTQSRGTVIIVDYALPRNRLIRSLVYGIVKAYESIYYPDFINSDFTSLLAKQGLQLIEYHPALAGTARIVKAVNLKGSKAITPGH